jgi:ribonucleoside-diphosphate reductase alpha chain
MKKEYLGITIDYSRDQLIPEQGLALLKGKGFYKKDHENSPQESFARAATCFSFGDMELAQRIYDYVSKQYFMFASPILSNAVEIDWTKLKFGEYDFKRMYEEHSGKAFEIAGDYIEQFVEPDGLPISCFISEVSDTKEGLVTAKTETNWLSMLGGGIGLSMRNRAPDEKSTGIMAHLRGYDADTLSMKQTSTRRGSIAAYADIEHPEIMNFISMRNPIGGDQNKKCFNLNNGVCIPDSFMHSVINDEKFELKDPKHGPTGNFISARDVWEDILKTRYETGEPYILFIDNVNNNIPKHITNKNYTVKSSNLCAEIVEYTSPKRTAVCCLSSLNIELYDEYKDLDIIQDIVTFLDNVLEYFIRLAPKEIERAVYSASMERSIGLGAMGFHSYLQKNNIAFESGGFNSASQLNNKIFNDIKTKALAASKVLGGNRGEAPDCEGTGYRNANLMAIAPNASSSSIIGTSPSIEPWNSNAFNAQGRTGSFLIKNKYLKEVLIKHSKDTEEVWKDIILNEGSVQHLTFLTDHEKNVFKTANEINQMWVVEHAADRQQYVCQSQSLNIFVDNTITLQELSDIHIKGWSKGVKAFYYLRSKPAVRANLNSAEGKPMNAMNVKTTVEFDECLSCQG